MTPMMASSTRRLASMVAGTALASWMYRPCDTRTKCDEGLQENAEANTTKGTTSSMPDDHHRKAAWLGDGQCLERQLWKPKLPYPLWDYNWDGKMTPETTMEALIKSNGQPVPGTTRHIILIRHGQYDETYPEDSKRILTDLGRVQAELTGERLAIMAKGINDKFGACDMKVIRVSDMARAKETADIIAKHLSSVRQTEPDAMLNEALPALIIPIRPEIQSEREIDENRARIEAAFQKYIHRANPVEEDGHRHEFEIIVGHGNIIRYFVCRALQLPPEAWLRMSIFNCSLTYLVIKPNGYCSCRLVGDVGHLGYDHTTFSGGHGFAWA